MGRLESKVVVFLSHARTNEAPPVGLGAIWKTEEPQTAASFHLRQDQDPGNKFSVLYLLAHVAAIPATRVGTKTTPNTI